MSNRSLLEFNHDYCPKSDGSGDEAFGRKLRYYLSSGRAEALPDGVTRLQMRHHSDPEPTGWVPPQDRARGFKCLGYVPWMKDWAVVLWEDDRYNKRQRPYWSIDGQQTSTSRANQPTAFLPMPDPPTTTTARAPGE